MSTEAQQRPRLALTVGDPAGIGPEIVLASLERAEVRRACRLVVLGPQALRPAHVPAFDPSATLGSAPEVAWLATEAPERWTMGEVQASCGRAALAALRAGVDLATSGAVDGLVTAPVNKEALHLAGEKVEGQTELLARWAGVTEYEMLAVAGELRVMLVTRHLPLRQALERITTDTVAEHLVLFERTLRGLGIAHPRLALAGLNPHAGEGGILGSEEDEVLVPALERARAAGLDVSGPVSPDSVFLMALRGAFDGVLALYHDQAFIPLKLVSEERGVTLVAGLPYLRVSPVHGTAFDIAGRGRASAENLVQALVQCAAWAAHRTSQEGPGRDSLVDF